MAHLSDMLAITNGQRRVDAATGIMYHEGSAVHAMSLGFMAPVPIQLSMDVMHARPVTLYPPAKSFNYGYTV